MCVSGETAASNVIGAKNVLDANSRTDENAESCKFRLKISKQPRHRDVYTRTVHIILDEYFKLTPNTHTQIYKHAMRSDPTEDWRACVVNSLPRKFNYIVCVHVLDKCAHVSNSSTAPKDTDRPVFSISPN